MTPKPRSGELKRNEEPSAASCMYLYVEIETQPSEQEDIWRRFSISPGLRVRCSTPAIHRLRRDERGHCTVNGGGQAEAHKGPAPRGPGHVQDALKGRPECRDRFDSYRFLPSLHHISLSLPPRFFAMGVLDVVPVCAHVTANRAWGDTDSSIGRRFDWR